MCLTCAHVWVCVYRHMCTFSKLHSFRYSATISAIHFFVYYIAFHYEQKKIEKGWRWNLSHALFLITIPREHSVKGGLNSKDTSVRQEAMTLGRGTSGEDQLACQVPWSSPMAAICLQLPQTLLLPRPNYRTILMKAFVHCFPRGSSRCPSSALSQSLAKGGWRVSRLAQTHQDPSSASTSSPVFWHLAA